MVLAVVAPGCFLTVPARASLETRFAVQRLVDAEGAAPRVTSDLATGAIVALRAAAVPLAQGRSRPAAAACEWLQAHAEAFGLVAGVDRLQVERDEPLPGGTHRVLLRQYWNGYPVESGDARCIVDGSGQLSFVASGFLCDLAAPVRARIGREAAIAVAAGALGVSLARAPAAAGLWVRRRGSRDQLAWAVRLSLAYGFEPRVWIDAVSGEVLETETGCANAVGFVYPSDPRGPVAEMPLFRLEPGVGLVSHLFGVEDGLYPPLAPLGPDGDYRVPPDQPSFDQVNVYWHADRFLHDFMGSLGYGGPPDSIIVRINIAVEPFVALTNDRFVSLGRPIPGFVQDVARCQDIIYHELTHAVIYGFGILPTGPNREAAALHEGLADYFSCALTGDPVVGEWLYLTFPNGATRLDQPAVPWNYQHYDRVGFAGGDAGSPWGNGMILSSGLWDLRRDIGTSADSLVLESLTYLPTTPIWAQFANALLQADQDHHAGRFATAIITTLLRRGIRGVGSSSFAGISGPSALAPGVEGEFEAVPCCSVPLETYRWRVRTWCRGAPCGDWREAGEAPVLRIAFDDDAEIELRAASPWADTITATRLIGVRPPQLVVQGPRRLAQHARGTWQARVAAMGPVHVAWTRQLRRRGAPLESLGTDLEQSFAADTSMELSVRLQDGLGRSVQQYLEVETFADHPPPLSSGLFRMTQVLDAGAHHAETTLELNHASPLKLVVYDVRGRVRATLWDGPAERGTHIVRWDPGGLEPGMYFLRLVAEPTGILNRFIVVR